MPHLRTLARLLTACWLLLLPASWQLLFGAAAVAATTRGGERILVSHTLAQTGQHFRRLLDHDQLQHARQAARRRLSDAAGAELTWVSHGRNIGVDVMQLPAGTDAASVVEALRNLTGVVFAELDMEVSAYGTPHPGPPDDEYFGLQWGMHRLGLYTNFSTDASNSLDMQGSAWNRSTGSQDVIVCVIDSGIDYKHPDLQGNLWLNEKEIPWNGIDDDNNGFVDDYYGWNFLNDSAHTMDDYFHGTHLAGIVGAVCNNELGVCGVNQQVKVMACKFLDQNGNGYTSNAVQCLDYALQMGAHITLNSYGGLYADSDGLRTAIGVAEAAGQLFVTAAGNDYGADIDETPTFPAAYPNENILSVIATNESNLLANYSNYGAENADIAAPGSNILSTVPASQYGWHTGTSQSAGFAAAAAALVLAGYLQAGFDINSCGAAVKPVLLGAGVLVQPSLQDLCATGGMIDISTAMAAIPRSAPMPTAGALPRCTYQQQTGCQSCSLPWGNQMLAPGPVPAAITLPCAPSTGGGSPHGVMTKSLSVADPFGSLTPALSGVYASPVQLFSGTFGLKHTSLAFIPAQAGGFNSCGLRSLKAFQSNTSYGDDITAQLLDPVGAGAVELFLPDPMPYESGQVASLQVTSSGMLRLRVTASTTPPSPQSPPLTFGAPANASPNLRPGLPAPVQVLPEGDAAAQASIAAFQADTVISLAGGDLDLVGGGQVLHYLRPDRLVVSFLDVASAASEERSSFQAELFFGGSLQPPGTIRLAWLDMGVQGALVGASFGPASPVIQSDFTAAVACYQPATLLISPEQLSEAVQVDGAAHLSVALTNSGNTTLALTASLEEQGPNMLQPNLWLNDATGYNQTYAQDNSTCAMYDPASDPVCVTFKTSSQTVHEVGNFPRPMRLILALQAPLKIQARLFRNHQCSNQYMVMSTKPTPPSHFGEDGSVWLVMACARKYLYAPGLTMQSSAPCAQFGPNHLDVTVNATSVTFSDDQCEALTAPQPFHELPVYLYIGAACKATDCIGGTEWTGLQIPHGLSGSASPAEADPELTSKSLSAAEAPTLQAGAVQPPEPAPAGLAPQHHTQLLATAHISHKLAAPAPAPDAASLPSTTDSDSTAHLPRTRIVLKRGKHNAAVDLSSLLSAAMGPPASPGMMQAASLSAAGPTTVLNDAPTWVVLDKQSVMLAGGQSSGLGMSFTGDLQAGNYTAELVIRSNDPERPVVRMPVEYIVP